MTVYLENTDGNMHVYTAKDLIKKIPVIGQLVRVYDGYVEISNGLSNKLKQAADRIYFFDFYSFRPQDAVTSKYKELFDPESFPRLATAKEIENYAKEHVTETAECPILLQDLVTGDPENEVVILGEKTNGDKEQTGHCFGKVEHISCLEQSQRALIASYNKMKEQGLRTKRVISTKHYTCPTCDLNLVDASKLMAVKVSSISKVIRSENTSKVVVINDGGKNKILVMSDDKKTIYEKISEGSSSTKIATVKLGGNFVIQCAVAATLMSSSMLFLSFLLIEESIGPQFQVLLFSSLAIVGMFLMNKIEQSKQTKFDVAKELYNF